MRRANQGQLVTIPGEQLAGGQAVEHAETQVGGPQPPVLVMADILGLACKANVR